jgi:hypothetical protein
VIQYPNNPEIILKLNSSLSTVEFNQKDTNQILAGCLNEQVCKKIFRLILLIIEGIFDLRKGHKTS